MSRPSVVTVSSFGRQKLIDNMTRVSASMFNIFRKLFDCNCLSYIILMFLDNNNHIGVSKARKSKMKSLKRFNF